MDFFVFHQQKPEKYNNISANIGERGGGRRKGSSIKHVLLKSQDKFWEGLPKESSVNENT